MLCYTSLRFTCGATPADLLAASMAAEPSLPHTCEALVGLETGRNKVRYFPYLLCKLEAEYSMFHLPDKCLN